MMGIHKGTKLTDNPKKHTLNFRYDDETEKKLSYLSEKRNLTKAEIIRKGIDIQYNKEIE
jgi:predicted DNA-binding protein